MHGILEEMVNWVIVDINLHIWLVFEGEGRDKVDQGNRVTTVFS